MQIVCKQAALQLILSDVEPLIKELDVLLHNILPQKRQCRAGEAVFEQVIQFGPDSSREAKPEICGPNHANTYSFNHRLSTDVNSDTQRQPRDLS